MTNLSSTSNDHRILMVSPQPFFRPRGTPFSVLHRIRALCEGGYRVDLVTYPFGEDVAIDGLTIYRSPKPPLIQDVKIGPSVAKIFLDLPLYRETVRRLQSGQYTVLHSHEEAAFFCSRLARRHRLLHIYDMHSSLPQQLANFGAFNTTLFRKSFEKLERHTLHTAHGVITICDDLAQIVQRIAPEIPHRMIENTADDRMIFPPIGQDIRAELGLGDRPVVLYTGTLEPYQGIDMLLDAMTMVLQQNPNAILIVVGGSPAQVARYTRMASGLGIGDSVKFTGSVSPKDIPAYLSTADAIASPRSRGTNTPLKIYGYLRAAKPIVATNLLTHTQSLSTENAMLVDPTPLAFARGISCVLDDSSLADRLAAGASQLADTQFSDSAYIRAVLELYDSVLEANSTTKSQHASLVH